MAKQKLVLNITTLKFFEEKYATSMQSVKDRIRKQFKEELLIGQGYDLDKYTAKKEIDKLVNFLKTNEFEQKYGRKFNIVDLYLTTNLQVSDILENYEDYITTDDMTTFVSFIKNTLKEIDNKCSYQVSTNAISKTFLISRFYQPSQVGIDRITKLKLLNYISINASLEDAQKAHEILLDLNEKYGVKYDDISLYTILRSVVQNEIDSYYLVAEDYKKELDQYTHVQKRCTPLLTRRERN